MPTNERGHGVPTATVAPTDQAPATFLEISLDRIDESPANPRKTFKQIEELAEDLKLHGMLQPVLVRPLENGKKDRFELVCGARRLRAARLAKLVTVPATVRPLSDDKSLELMIIENSQREDVHPLEEAEGYETLHKKHGYSADDIAGKTGKSKSWVYQRMKLLALCPEARKAFAADQISASVAVLLARIPSPKLQAEALKDVSGGRWNDDPMSHQRAVEHIQERYMLRLDSAPFDRADAKLLPAAGPCTTCPKRTGNQPELFSDVKSADVCTEPTCFQKKVDAWGQKRLEELKEKGAKVVAGQEAKKMFPSWCSGDDIQAESAGYVSLDQQCYEDRKHRTYRQIIKDPDAPIAVAVHPKSGKVFELLPVKWAKSALRKAGVKNAYSSQRSSSPGRSKAEIEREKNKRAIEDKTRECFVAAIVAAAEKMGPSTKFLRAVAQDLARNADVEQLVERRGLVPGLKDGKRARTAGMSNIYRLADTLIAGLNDAQLCGVIMEFAAWDSSWNLKSPEAKETAAAFGVDLQQCARDAKAIVERTAAEAKVFAKPAAKSERRCRVCGCTETTPCIMADGSTCSWVSADLCSSPRCMRQNNDARKNRAKAAKQPKAGKKLRPGPDAKYQPSEALAVIVKANPLTRTDVTKKIWAYIKRNGLQDAKKRTMINPDDVLGAVLGTKRVSMFEMTKRVGKHLKQVE